MYHGKQDFVSFSSARLFVSTFFNSADIFKHLFSSFCLLTPKTDIYFFCKPYKGFAKLCSLGVEKHLFLGQKGSDRDE